MVIVMSGMSSTYTVLLSIKVVNWPLLKMIKFYGLGCQEKKKTVRENLIKKSKSQNIDKI